MPEEVDENKNEDSSKYLTIDERNNFSNPPRSTWNYAFPGSLLEPRKRIGSLKVRSSGVSWAFPERCVSTSRVLEWRKSDTFFRFRQMNRLLRRLTCEDQSQHSRNSIWLESQWTYGTHLRTILLRETKNIFIGLFLYSLTLRHFIQFVIATSSSHIQI